MKTFKYLHAWTYCQGDISVIRREDALNMLLAPGPGAAALFFMQGVSMVSDTVYWVSVAEQTGAQWLVSLTPRLIDYGDFESIKFETSVQPVQARA